MGNTYLYYDMIQAFCPAQLMVSAHYPTNMNNISMLVPSFVRVQTIFRLRNQTGYIQLLYQVLSYLIPAELLFLVANVFVKIWAATHDILPR